MSCARTAGETVPAVRMGGVLWASWNLNSGHAGEGRRGCECGHSEAIVFRWIRDRGVVINDWILRGGWTRKRTEQSLASARARSQSKAENVNICVVIYLKKGCEWWRMYAPDLYVACLWCCVRSSNICVCYCVERVLSELLANIVMWVVIWENSEWIWERSVWRREEKGVWKGCDVWGVEP